METKTHCVYNKTTERFLSVGVNVVDSTLEPLKALRMLVDLNDLNPESGLWLTPFRGIPVARIFSPLDLVYLDEDYRVVQGVELFPGVELAPQEGLAASALVMPFHTIRTSLTHPGDQLIICVADELVRHLGHVPISPPPTPVMQGTGSPAEQSSGNGGLAPSLAGDRSGRRQAATQPLDEKEKVKSQAKEKDLLKAEVLHWAEKMGHHLARAPIPTTPAPVAQSAESPTEQPHGNGGLAPFLSGSRSGRRQTAIQPLDEKEKVESKAQDNDSLISQVLRRDEEVERPIAHSPVSAAPAPVAQSTESPSEQPAPRKKRKKAKSSVSQSTISPVEQPAPKNGHKKATPSVSQSTISAPEQHSGNGDLAPSLSGDRYGLQQAAVQRLDEIRKAGSRAQEMDSLRIYFPRWAKEMVRWFAQIPILTTPAPVSQSTEPQSEQPRGSGDLAPSLAGDFSRQQQAAIQRLDEKEKAASLAREKDSLKTRLPRRTEEMVRRLARISSATTPVRVSQNTKSPVEQPAPKNGHKKATPSVSQTTKSASEQLRDYGALAPSLWHGRSRRQQAEIQRLDEKEKAESQAREWDSLRSKFPRWTEENLRQLARIPVSTSPAPVSQRTESPAEQPRINGGFAPSLSGSRSRQQQASIQRLVKKEKAESKVQEKNSLKTLFPRWTQEMVRFLRWLYADSIPADTPPPDNHPLDRRRSCRHFSPKLVAYYWTGGTPQAHKIVDISATGFYLVTQERWLPETMIRMTLQRADVNGQDSEDAISVLSKVIRWGLDGVGHEFVLSDPEDLDSDKLLPEKGTDQQALERFLIPEAAKAPRADGATSRVF